MWSRRVLLATMVAAAAVMLARHGSTSAPVPGYVQAPAAFHTSFR
jgi:hypothetical protein